MKTTWLAITSKITMKKRYSLYFIAFLAIEIPFLIAFAGWLRLLQTNVEHSQIIQTQDLFQIVLPPNQKETSQTSLQVYRTDFEGLDAEDLLVKIEGATGQNLQVSLTYDQRTKKSFVALSYNKLAFPKIIDITKTSGRNPSKKYAYVHHQYNDQLSKNTRAFISLCAQAGTTGRKVVRPFVKQTKLSSDKSWLSLETYYDIQYLDSLLAAVDYATLVDIGEYLKECPSNSPDHVSVHFIDNSQASTGFTTNTLRLKKDYYKAILKNTTQKGWTECSFLDRAMKRTPGKQYCVNGDIIKDWKVFEKDIVKNEKCLNIYLWRGIDGVTYRLKFSEDSMKFSSIDVTYALKPGQPVINEVKRFAKDALDENYIAVYVRGEFMLRGSSMDYLRKCVDLVLEVLVPLKRITRLSRVYVATDMGEYGSSWLVKYRRENHLDENFFNLIHDHMIEKSQGVSYTPPPHVQDRGMISLVDMSLVSNAQYLISAGTGTFQAWISAKFLQNHRNDEQRWSKITVC